jgi:hypothetical protein
LSGNYSNPPACRDEASAKAGQTNNFPSVSSLLLTPKKPFSVNFTYPADTGRVVDGKVL